MRNFSIGKLSKQTACKIPTIRFYEKEGLLQLPYRTEGNQRRYNENHLKRLSFILHARQLGFTLDDVRELIALSENEHNGHDADRIAEKHLQSVQGKIERLEALRRELRSMLEACSKETMKRCFVIDVLSDHSLCGEDH